MCLWFCSQHVLQVVSQHALQVSRGSLPACLAGLQAHTQGGSWGVWPGGSPGPHPMGFPGPHPGGSPGPHLQEGGYPSMHWGRPPPQADGYCCGRYTSYWNAFLSFFNFWFLRTKFEIPRCAFGEELFLWSKPTCKDDSLPHTRK